MVMTKLFFWGGAEYISLFADQEPLFGGRTPIDIYRDFMAAFVKDLASFIGPVVFEAGSLLLLNISNRLLAAFNF